MNQLLEKKYLKLQNGSDVRGVALENPDGEQVNLTPEIVTYIAAAFAEYLAEKVGKDMSELTISVGHDSRLSADALKAGVLAGIQKQGCQAVDCSLASTPSMFMSTVLPQLSYDGAIMITDSHLPFQRNGMKFFSKEGGLESKEIKILLNKAIALPTCPSRLQCPVLCPLSSRSPSLLCPLPFGPLPVLPKRAPLVAPSTMRLTPSPRCI